jgi:dienelactone hydrolase
MEKWNPNKLQKYFDTKRIRKELNLFPRYDPVEDRLNSMLWLVDKYQKIPKELHFNPSKYHSVSEIKLWQSALKAKVTELLGLPFEHSPLNIEWGRSSEYHGVKLTKILFNSQPGLVVPAILAHPVGLSTPAPAAICLHGHNTGKIAALGFDHSSSHSYYSIELAQRGWVTLTLDQFGFGERYGIFHQRRKSSESDLALASLLLGFSSIGIRVWDVMRGVDFLLTLKMVDPTKLITIGQSGGGTTSAFAGALDDRIAIAVISGYFCNLFDSIFTIHHCACNYVPNLLRYAELSDIVGIRAPKPTFIISGDQDHIFPQSGVQKAYQELKYIYQAFNAEKELEIDVWRNHGHEFRGNLAYPWIESKLAKL